MNINIQIVEEVEGILLECELKKERSITSNILDVSVSEILSEIDRDIEKCLEMIKPIDDEMIKEIALAKLAEFLV